MPKPAPDMVEEHVVIAAHTSGEKQVPEVASDTTEEKAGIAMRHRRKQQPTKAILDSVEEQMPNGLLGSTMESK